MFVVVDRLSKDAHSVESLKHPYIVVSVALVCIKKVVMLHGVPRSIVSEMYSLRLVLGLI